MAITASAMPRPIWAWSQNVGDCGTMRRMEINGLVAISQIERAAASQCWARPVRSSRLFTSGGRCGPCGLAERCNAFGEAVHFVPFGEFGVGVRVGGPLGQPHDEADDVAVCETVALVVQVPGEHPDQVRRPRAFLEKGLYVGIGLRRVLARLARDQIDREEATGTLLEQCQ